MSGTFCGCASLGNGNTGRTSKSLVFQKAKALILVQKIADDGTLNAIAESDFVDGELPASYITEKLNHSDGSKRWYPISKLEDVDSVRGDVARSSAETGENTQITAVAIRPFSANISYANAIYLRNLERFQCDQYAVYIVDQCGNISGEVKPTDPTNLRPWCIATRTWYPNLVFAQGDETEMANIVFEFDSNSKDSNREVIPASDFGADALDLQGLLNLNAAISNESTTGFTATLTLEYGAFGDKCLQTGLVAGDFELYNITDSAAVVIDSLTESANGVYDITFAAQDSADVLELRQSSTGDKYSKEGFELVVPTITIP